MFELASALFSIADANEFRFARFYIVCEAVPLGTPESPPIVCGLPDTSCGLSKRGKDTEYNVKSGMQEIHVFLLQRFSTPASILEQDDSSPSDPVNPVTIPLPICQPSSGTNRLSTGFQPSGRGSLLRSVSPQALLFRSHGYPHSCCARYCASRQSLHPAESY